MKIKVAEWNAMSDDDKQAALNKRVKAGESK